MSKRKIAYYGVTTLSIAVICLGCRHDNQNQSQPNEAAGETASVQKGPTSPGTSTVQDASKQPNNLSESAKSSIRKKAVERFEKGVWEKLSKRKTKIPDEIFEGIESCWKEWETLDLDPAPEDKNQIKVAPFITDTPIIKYSLPNYKTVLTEGLSSKQIAESSWVFPFKNEYGRTSNRVVYKLYGNWRCDGGDPFTSSILFRNIDWNLYRFGNTAIGFLQTYDMEVHYLVVIPDGEQVDKAKFYGLKLVREPYTRPYYKVEKTYTTIEKIISELIAQAEFIALEKESGDEK